MVQSEFDFEAAEAEGKTKVKEKVYKWFDDLDLNSLSVIQRVFPGREMLQEQLKIINSGAAKNLSRGNLVASISRNFIADDICQLITAVVEGSPLPPTSVSAAHA